VNAVGIVLALAVAQVAQPAPPAAPAPAAPARPVLPFTAALKKAAEQNLDLKVAQARLDQARTATAKAWAAYLPQISAGGSYTRNNAGAAISLPTGFAIRNCGVAPCPNTPEGLPGGPTPYFMYPTGMISLEIQKVEQWGAQAQLNQVLLSPSLIAAIRMTYTAVDVASLTVANARRQLLLGVAAAYYGAAAAGEVRAVYERQVAVAQIHVDDADVRFKAGALPRLGVLRAQIDLTKAQRDLERARNTYESAKLALATLIDEPANFDVQTPEGPQVPEAMVRDPKPAQDRPDLAAARASLDLAEQGRVVTALKYAPNVAGSAVYRWANVAGFTGENTSWFAMVGLSWTLWDGGTREAELREASAKVVEAKASLRNTENKAQEDASRAALDFESARGNAAKADEQVRLARENQDLVEVSFKNGAATPVEVADANAALLGAEIGAVGEHIQSSIAALRLLTAVGQFPPADLR